MMKEKIFNLIKMHHYNISIYTAEIFERRCQEEIIRSDEEQSSFVYLEFDFDAIGKSLLTEENSDLFWNVFFAALAKNNRRSDIIGFLENDSGLGILLLDSKMPGWERVKGRILQTAREQNFNLAASVINQIIKPIIYPSCVQDIETSSGL